MRIQCPNCQAVYAVPDQRLEGHRTVRCARCAESWVPEPMPEPIPDPDPLPEPEPEPPPMPVAIPVGLDTAAESEQSLAPRVRVAMPELALRRDMPPVTLLAAWAASIATVAIMLVLLFAEHRAIADAWPPMARLYGLFGLG